MADHICRISIMALPPTAALCRRQRFFFAGSWRLAVGCTARSALLCWSAAAREASPCSLPPLLCRAFYGALASPLGLTSPHSGPRATDEPGCTHGTQARVDQSKTSRPVYALVHSSASFARFVGGRCDSVFLSRDQWRGGTAPATP